MAVLTDDEKERITEAERFRREVREQLGIDSTRENGLSRVLKHPAFLLMLGFLLTGLVGGCLTEYWKNEEAKNQRSYLLQQRLLDKRYELFGKTFNAVAKTTTAAEDILASQTWGRWSPAEIREFKSHWIATSREWRVSSKILDQELAIYFANPEIRATFDQIIEKRLEMGNDITNLLRSSESPTGDATTRKAALDLNNEIDSLLHKCGTLMTSEAAPGS
jgi:hypothetical protein